MISASTAVLFAAGTASATPPRSLLEALAAGDATPAKMAQLLSYAEAGNGEAAEVAGFLFATGRPDPQLVDAFYWYLRAASAGQPDAMDNGVRVWRSMTREQQRQAEKRLATAFTATEIAALTDLWGVSHARLPFADPKKTDHAAKKH